MKTYFSIGETAKLHGISIQTLRHYDKIGLLKPIKINEETGYRYYSIEQFLILDLIKSWKAIGLSLEEIKTAISEKEKIEDFLAFIQKQKEDVKEQIQELDKLYRYLSNFESRIVTTLNKPMNEVFLCEKEEQVYIEYPYGARSYEEYELCIRKVILDVEQTMGNVHMELSAVIDFDMVKKEQQVYHKSFLIKETEGVVVEPERLKSFPKGLYATLMIDDNSVNNINYYEKIIQFIEMNNLKPIGDFHEKYIIPRLDSQGKERTFTEIELLVER